LISLFPFSKTQSFVFLFSLLQMGPFLCFFEFHDWIQPPILTPSATRDRSFFLLRSAPSIGSFWWSFRWGFMVGSFLAAESFFLATAAPLFYSLSGRHRSFILEEVCPQVLPWCFLFPCECFPSPQRPTRLPFFFFFFFVSLLVVVCTSLFSPNSVGLSSPLTSLHGYLLRPR